MLRSRLLQRLLGCTPFVLATLAPASAQSAAKLTLQIVPTTYSSLNSPEPTINFSASRHFHVLLTNTSALPIALFEEWNSSGYYGLSFALTYPDGRTVRVVKSPRMWERNFPSTITLAPGGFYVFDVTFAPNTWQNSPLQELLPVQKKRTGEPIRCRMRAIYTITPDDDSRKNAWTKKGVPVWTGTIKSAEKAYILWP
jgi:hypothetical protein